MITSMSMQTMLYAAAAVMGIMCGLAYDFIRLIRRLVRHNLTAVHIEDGFFWTACTAVVFLFYYRLNYAEIRAFIFIGFFGGMIFYYAALSKLLHKAARTVLRFFAHKRF